jgi:hypothetical protein
MMFSPAESPLTSPKASGERPKFTSKIHIPVELSKEVTALPPAGYQLVFNDEFDGDAVDTDRWGFRLVDKMLSAQQLENVSVIRVYQHPQYREAEAAVRAEVLRPRPPLDTKKATESGPKSEDLN